MDMEASVDRTTVENLRREIESLRALVADRDDSLSFLNSTLSFAEDIGRERADKKRASEIAFKNQEIIALQNENKDLRRELEFSKKLKVDTKINLVKVEQIADKSNKDFMISQSPTASDSFLVKEDDGCFLMILPLLTALRVTRSHLSCLVTRERSEVFRRCSDILDKALNDVIGMVESIGTIKVNSSVESIACSRLHAECLRTAANAAFEIFDTYLQTTNSSGTVGAKRPLSIEAEHDGIGSILSRALCVICHTSTLMPTVPSYESKISDARNKSLDCNNCTSNAVNDANIASMSSLAVNPTFIVPFAQSRTKIARLIRNMGSEGSTYMVTALEELISLFITVASDRAIICSSSVIAFQIRSHLSDIAVGIQYISSGMSSIVLSQSNSTFSTNNPGTSVFGVLLQQQRPGSARICDTGATSLLSALLGLILDIANQAASFSEIAHRGCHTSLLELLRRSIRERSVLEAFLACDQNMAPSFISSLLHLLNNTTREGRDNAFSTSTHGQRTGDDGCNYETYFKFRIEILLFLEQLLLLQIPQALRVIMPKMEISSGGAISSASAAGYRSSLNTQDSLHHANDGDVQTAPKILSSLLVRLHRLLERVSSHPSHSPISDLYGPLLVYNRSRAAAHVNLLYELVEAVARVLDRVVGALISSSGGCRSSGSSILGATMHERLGALLIQCRGGICGEKLKTLLTKNCSHIEKLFH